jgi:hypothetical protein
MSGIFNNWILALASQLRAVKTPDPLRREDAAAVRGTELKNFIGDTLACAAGQTIRVLVSLRAHSPQLFQEPPKAHGTFGPRAVAGGGVELIGNPW